MIPYKQIAKWKSHDPCIGCTERGIVYDAAGIAHACHSTCKRRAEWLAEIEQKANDLRESNNAYAITFSYKLDSIKRRKEGKK